MDETTFHHKSMRDHLVNPRIGRQLLTPWTRYIAIEYARCVHTSQTITEIAIEEVEINEMTLIIHWYETESECTIKTSQKFIVIFLHTILWKTYDSEQPYYMRPTCHAIIRLTSL